tara:strand:+ start:224 stop:826 length:603 start_codon:yes stop_codon:yes gene_type:complete
MKYKLFKFNEFYTIQRVSDNTSFSQDIESRAYQQFVEDIYEQGIGIVEGADYVGVTTYTEARAAEYPPIVDQLDKIYHNGIDAWKADIKVIKDKYPKTQVGITSIAPIPDWVYTALFEKQKEKYVEAKARLARYELSAGVRNEAGDGSGTYAIEPLPISIVDDEGNTIRNPLVVQDETEREAAQEIINKTPQSVIDSINN